MEIFIIDGYDFYEWFNFWNLNEEMIIVFDDYLVIVISVDGCEQIFDFFVVEFIVLIFIIFGDLLICEGEIINFEVDGFYVFYLWLIMEINFEIVVIISDMYLVIVIDDNGCEGEVSVEVMINFLLDLVIMGDVLICLDEQMMLIVIIGFIFYMWLIIEISESIMVSILGIYMVMGMDFSGCENIVIFMVE